VHTGDSGQGLTHGVVGGILLSNLILGHTAAWAEFYDPGRVVLRAARNLVAENVTALKNLAEYVAPGELTSSDEVKPGQGAILRDGLTKIAVYRDESGALYRQSAACTHACCHVQWNSLERCWDCPCHGSHFAADGTALNAPAVQALSSVPSGDVAEKAKAKERTS
jgi:Rieske Fe-S protein